MDNKEEGEEEDAEKNARGSIAVLFEFSRIRIQPRARSSIGDGYVVFVSWAFDNLGTFCCLHPVHVSPEMEQNSLFGHWYKYVQELNINKYIYK